MYPKIAFIVLMAVCVAPEITFAEKANESPVNLRNMASHVIVGKVVAVYQLSEVDKDWNYTRYVAEIRVKDCEKGDGIKKGELVYARYWTRAWHSNRPPVPDTSGYRGLPSTGETVRVYLARNAYDGTGYGNTGGGFDVIFPNGFERLRSDK